MKEKNSKRVLSWLLALTMVFSLLPTAAFAAEEQDLLTETCICDVLCSAEEPNTDCPVCAADAANCTAEAPAEEPAESPAEEPPAQKVILGFLDMPANSSMKLLPGGEPEIPDVLNANVEDQEDAEEVPVTWTSEPTFDKDAEGAYVFTSALAAPDAYALAADVEMPSVTVTVTAEIPLGRENLTAGSNVTVNTWNDFKTEIAKSGTFTITLGADLTATGKATLSTTENSCVTVDGDGHTITKGMNWSEDDAKGWYPGVINLIGATTTNELILKNITIDGGGAENSAAEGASLIALTTSNANQTLSLQSGTVLQNLFLSKNGGAVASAGGIINMEAGSVIQNISIVGDVLNSNYVGAILLMGSMNMHGGEIKNCRLSTSEKSAAIYIEHSNKSNAVFNMTGGRITGNTKASGSVGSAGVYGKGGIKLSGSAYIYDNKMDDAQSNVYLVTGKTIDIGSGFSAGAKVGIYTQAPVSEGSPVVFATADSADAASKAVSYVHSDKPTNAGIVADGTNIKLDYAAKGMTDAYVSPQGTVNGGSGTKDDPYATIGEAYAAIINGGTIHVMDDLTVAAEVAFTTVNKSVTILSDSNGNLNDGERITVTRGPNATGPLFTSNATGSKVTFKNITVDGGGNGVANVVGPLIMAGKDTDNNNAGSVTLADGVTLQNNHNTSATVWGGGLYVSGTGSAIIETGVMITGNAAQYGGGVHANRKSSLTMTGGTITGNITRAGDAGAISLNQVQTFNMSGNVKVYDNFGADQKTAKNIYIGANQLITFVNGGLTSGADIGVYTATPPSLSADVQIARSAKKDDLAYIHSDNAAEAGVLFCDGTDADGGKHTHTGNGNTLWLSVKAKAKLADTYVKGTYTGNDSDGTKDKPFTTLADAYAATANNGVIHVMKNLSLTTGVSFDQDKAVTIRSDDGEDSTPNDSFSILRDANYNSTLLSISGGTVTLQNITVDGQKIEAANDTALVVVSKGAKAVLDKGVTLQGYYRSTEGYSRGAIFVTGNDSLVTMKDGALITGNSSGYGGGVMVGSKETTTARFLMAGGTITENTSISMKTAAGYGGAGVYVWGGTFEMTGGSITKNTSAGNGGGIEVYTGAAKLTGGEISDNTAQRGGGVLLDSGTLTIGGTIQVDHNKDNGGQPQNVYLAKDQVVSIDPSSHLAEGAKIGVFTAVAPAPGTDIKIATGANSDDLKRMSSDNAAFAGIVWCNGETDGETTTHTDTPITTAGHTPEKDTLWLSVDARVAADIDVGLGENGTLTITVKNLNPDKFYTVLDKNGVPQTVAVTGGTAGDNGWYTPGQDGTLIFSGLPLDGAPYQVVTNDKDFAAPNGKAEETNETKVGGQITALYVAGDAGSGWAAGDDTNGNGTRATPFLTLNKAYAELDGKFAQAGIITVLSDIEQSAALTFKATTGAIILGEGEKVAIKRTVGDNVSVGLFDVNGCAVTFSNLTFDGNKDSYTDTNAAFSVRSGGSLTLKDCVVENFAVKGNANGNWDKSLIHCGADTNLILDGAIIRNNSAMMSSWPLIASGNLTFKNSSVVNNHTNAGSAVSTFVSAKLEGVVVIDGNTYGATNVIRNLSVADVRVDAAGLAAGSKIGVTGTAPGYVPTADTDVPVTTGGAALAYFRSDEPANYGVKRGSGGEVYLALLSITAGDTDENGKTSIIIDPADPSKDYWAVDGEGNKVGPGTMNGDGTVTIAPLNPGTDYDVVIVEKGTPEDNISKDGSGPHFTAPDAPVNGSKVDRGDGTDPNKDKITVNDPSADLDYALVDKDGNFVMPNGAPAGEDTPWQNSDDGSALTWDNLDPDETYQVVSRPKGSENAIHSQGTPVLPNVPKETIGGGSYDPSNDTTSIVIKPADSNKTYWAVDGQGSKVGPGSVNGDGSVTISGLTPGGDYKVTATPNADDDPSSVGGGVNVVAPARPAVAPDEKDGGYKSNPAKNDEIKRENGYTAPYTDSITIKAEDGYSYAVRGADGKYYPASGGTAQTNPVWQSGSAGSELTFADLPNGQTYEVVKIPTSAESGFDSGSVVVLPAVTEVPAITNIGVGDVGDAIDGKTGSGYITVSNTDMAFQYIVLDKDGNAVSGVAGLVNPQTGNGDTLTFQPLMPGQDYTVVAVSSALSEAEAKAAAEARKDTGANVSVPAVGDGGMIAGKDPVNSGKTTVTINPASDQVKYVLTDETGKVVKVDTAANGKVVFDNLDADKHYKVYTVPVSESDPSGSVSIPDTAVNAKTPRADTTHNAADGKTDEGQNVTLDKTTTSITVNPTETGKEYAILDPATGLVVGAWTPGTDGTEVTFDGLVSGKQYEVLVRDAASVGAPASVPVSLGDVTTNSSSGGGGGSSGSSSAAKVESAKNGKVSVSPKNPGKGDKVTITAIPDKGYEVGTVTVTDKNGNAIQVTEEGNGKYSYIQPASSAQPVTVKVSFKKAADLAPDYDNCPKDETCPIARFTDASTTAWYHDGVHYCVDNGLMNGTSASTFNPNGTTTRGMIVTILYRLEGEPKTSGTSYPDVADGQYYADAVVWAAKNGIVTGYTNGNFGPNDPITREQMAAILYRYAGFKGYDVSAKADLGKFSDRNQVSGYAAEPLSWANAEGLVTGKGAGILDPKGNATRVQAATILMRFCEIIAK